MCKADLKTGFSICLMHLNKAQILQISWTGSLELPNSSIARFLLIAVLRNMKVYGWLPKKVIFGQPSSTSRWVTPKYAKPDHLLATIFLNALATILYIPSALIV